MSVEIIHPYVTQVEGVAGGKPVIRGTRTPVRSIVAYHRVGNTPEEIQVKVPHLSLAQIYDALSFYYDHQADIDADIEANREEYVRGTLDRWRTVSTSTKMWHGPRPAVSVASTSSAHRKPDTSGSQMKTSSRLRPEGSAVG